MGQPTIRTQVSIPKELVEAVDLLVGAAKRDDFIAGALEETLRREKRTRALKETAGALETGTYSEWETPAGVSAWVARLRADDAALSEHKLTNRARE